ncbi:hypothetical protein GCM10009837_24430 [Streptomyces durmitorensis]|uniref:DNA-binding protein n=1 Tax=Streptomyces durmitorensis TaxID=319947 RepID=A0ABY4PP59_9ACTN|nr:hypothetical protein [Streptomyces durmitorensis]UQT54944.1 hypothetical protein M4V62_07455 [Streptomyces durmitorensis]
MDDEDFATAVSPYAACTESPYTDAARARLAMAHEACDLADLARAAVPVGEHELLPDGTAGSPGSVLADAALVLRAAHRFFEAAAVTERLGGASWQVIGDVLGVDARTARARFAAAESCFREEISPDSDFDRDHEHRPDRDRDHELSEAGPWWRAYTLGNPLEAARDLDDWVLRHEDGDADLGPAPVSGGLATQSNKWSPLEGS